MGTGKLDIIEFSRIFSGNKQAFGVHEYDAPNEQGEKRSGKSRTATQPLTEKQYIEHLSGKQGLGIIPINERNKCQFSVIDIDEYKVSFKKYFKIVEDYGLPLSFFRSKSGGLHMYVFFDQEYPAKDVVEVMQKLLIVLGLKKDTEIFPKQTRIQKNGFGNWINLPYFDASNNPTQYLYDSEQNEMSLSQAIQHIKEQAVTVEELKDIVSSVPFADAPPCLQTLYILNDFNKDTHNRNDFLMQVATYLKNKYEEDFPKHLLDVNDRFPEPTPYKEIETTVINSHNRKTYAYGCKTPLLSAVCNKEVCKLRQFGITSLEAPSVDYGTLSQFVGLSTRYEWEVNNKVLKFNSEDDIMSQGNFLKLCIRELKEYPFRLSQKRWDRVIREAVDGMEVKDDKDEFSNETLFMDYLNKFLTEGAPARTKDQIGLHRVFLDMEIKCYVFRRVDLMDFLETKRFNKLKPKEVKEILVKIKSFEKKYPIEPSKTTRCWLTPVESVDNHLRIEEKPDDELLEDFGEYQEEGENEY